MESGDEEGAPADVGICLVKSLLGVEEDVEIDFAGESLNGMIVDGTEELVGDNEGRGRCAKSMGAASGLRSSRRRTRSGDGAAEELTGGGESMILFGDSE